MIRLAWDPTSDPTAAGYMIYFGPSSGNYTNQVDAGNGTNVTLTGLVPGATYYFAATTYTTNGLESSYSAEATVTLGNKPPTLAALTNITVAQDSGARTVNLAGISSGATSEVQTLTVTAVSSNPGLIPNPAVSYASPNTTGSLAFAPAPNAVGTASITVTVDDGSTISNTFSRTFVVTVNAVNHAPTLDPLINLTINEDAPQQSVNLIGISSGATNENQTLSITVVSANTAVVPTPTVNYTSPNATGSLTFTPVPTSFGSSLITVMVDDGGSISNTVIRSFTVTVNAVNHPPTLDPVADTVILENAGQQTVNLTGISTGATNEVQTLTVTAVSSAPSIIPNPTVTYSSPNATGTLTFSPVAYAFGSATITVNVNDGQSQNNYVTRSFLVTVSPVNQAPTLNAINDVNINWNSGAQTVPLSGITSGATNEFQTLTVTAVSSTPGLVPNPTVAYTSPSTAGSLSFTPGTNRYGSANITVTVNDGQAASNTVSRTFAVNVARIIPPATISNLAVLPDTLARVSVPAINSDRLTYSLDPYAPLWAKITSKGLVSLRPTSDDASTTNVVNVIITDVDNSARSTNGTIIVVVPDLIRVGAGATAVLAGQSNSVPLTLTTSDPTTNFTFSVQWPSTRLSNPSLSISAPGVASSTLQNQGTNLLINVRMSANQYLQGTNLLGQLRFQTVANQSSAFVPLVITNITGIKRTGLAYTDPDGKAGEVAIVAAQPLMRATTGANRGITVYGRPGTNYQVQVSSVLNSTPSWTPVSSFSQTNIVQTMYMSSPGSLVLYRLLQQ